jgi:crotonobetainyl-CoA:carnitine CoA-transferase CaiB-like acyl-CoA transferase
VRGGLPTRYPDCEPGERPYDRCFQFNTQNHDKRGLALDLKTEAGRSLAVELAGQADVLIANFSAGTLDRMGLGWERLRVRNPGLIVVEMPAYGAGGPMGAWVALGPSMEMMSGMGARIGYGDGRPTTTGPAYLDPIGGFNAAAAVLTALAARTATGEGQRVELAQREAAMHWIGEQIVHAIATGRDTEPDGNHVDDAAPHDAFPARGEDEWVAIAATTDAQFTALREVLGLEGWDGVSLADRKRDECALNEQIAARTRGRDKHELAAALQAAGVAAAPVANARDVASSAFLLERGLLATVDHPAVGVRLQQGLALHVEGWDLAVRAPAPCFGQDTERVLRERIGLDDAALAGLRDGDVISDRPRGADPRPARVEA